MYNFGSITCVIFMSMDDCDVYLGLVSEAGGVLRGDFEGPFEGDSGKLKAEAEIFDLAKQPEFPFANWKIDANALLPKTGAVCGVICVSVG